METPIANQKNIMQTEGLQYVGFWARVGATLIDTLLLGILIWPVLTKLYGQGYWLSDELIQGPADLLFGWILPAVVVILLWVKKQATPGKMLISARIVDAESGQKPSLGQYIKRYLGYYLAIMPLGLGIVWVAFDPRKQGWHDKLASTVVIRPKEPRPVVFNESP